MREIDQELLKAAEDGDMDRTAAALSAGADPNARNERGSPVLSVALNSAVDEKAVRNVKALLGQKSEEDLEREHQEAEGNLGRIAEALLAAGADPNWKYEDGWTPLMGCAMQGGRGMARRLLLAGADPDAQTDQEGWTALMLAAENGDEAMCELLLEHGANPRALASNGSMALDLAIGEGTSRAILHGMAQEERSKLDQGAEPEERKGKPLRL